jgi:DNA-binding NtrC family response regulator
MALRVLLVEDEAEIRAEILEYLGRRFHRVIAVGSYAEAWNLLSDASSTDPIDAVLCDLNLEDGNGVDLFARFASALPNCRWILMSGDPDHQRLKVERDRIPGLPPCTVVTKPVSLRYLDTLISKSFPP